MTKFMISYRTYKKPGKIYCSTFRGHRDSIKKRLVKSYANKEKYKISTERWTCKRIPSVPRCLFRPFIVISVLILYFSLSAYGLTSLLIMESRWPRNVEQYIFPGFLYVFASANLYWSNYRTDALKTDINLFFTITNCLFARSRLLTRRMNFKFMCLSAFWQ